MDNLARDAMLAKQAGMSYGRWKAMQPIVKVEEKKIPDGWKVCEHCGKPFKTNKAQRFCDIGCRTSAYANKASEQRRAYHKKWREQKKDGGTKQ